MEIKNHRLRAASLAIVFLLCGHNAKAEDELPGPVAVSYFITNEKRSDNLKPFPKWGNMRGRYGEQMKMPDDDCDKQQYFPCSVKEWRQLVSTLHGKTEAEQLKEVNEWGNAHPYIVDQMNWGMEDFWETPYEFMAVNGDCEDYAIAKYYSLKQLGYDDEQLRIVIVQDLNLGGIIHAILAVTGKDKEVFILDNQIPQVMPALKIYHYRPIYAINETAWWILTPKS